MVEARVLGSEDGVDRLEVLHLSNDEEIPRASSLETQLEFLKCY